MHQRPVTVETDIRVPINMNKQYYLLHTNCLLWKEINSKKIEWSEFANWHCNFLGWLDTFKELKL